MVHRGLTSFDGEAGELQQQVLGLLTADLGPHRVAVYVSDCRFVYQACLHDGAVLYCRLGLLHRAGVDFDVAHVHMPVPAVHVSTAVRLRLRGVPVVLSPMGMLSDDFAGSTWFRGRPVFARLKPMVVAVLRVLWGLVANRFIGLGNEEMRLGHLPPSRTAAVPWPVPSTGLGRAHAETATGDGLGSARGPVAFVSRFDVHRKGIDRLAAWLRAYGDELPRPAAVLFASDDAPDTSFLDDVVRDGLLEWDTNTSGADLLHRLGDCRGVILLSRWEAQARAMREGALLGLPTISTPTGNFAEVNEILDKGVIVDGDDPASIHRAFEDITGMSRSFERARELFDPANVGAFLFSLLQAAARGTPWTDADYYRYMGSRA